MTALTDEHLEELKKAFDELDTDQNGFLDEKELRLFCRICLEKRYEKVSDQLIDELVQRSIKLCDTSGDGLISFDEFVISYKKSEL